jgi:hypothetical protein
MRIKPEMRGFYPIDWPDISRRVRFERAAGMCQGCGRPHGMTVRCLPERRWFDATHHIWRNGHGRPSRWPDLIETARMQQTRVVLAAAHVDHDPSNNRLRNLKSLCQRCHIIHDRSYHLVQRRITYLADHRGHFNRCDHGGESDHHRARDFAPLIAPPSQNPVHRHPERGGTSASWRLTSPPIRWSRASRLALPSRPIGHRRQFEGMLNLQIFSTNRRRK